jgi:protein-S-isoprenylcysteine O-methyltransferase Ste14
MAATATLIRSNRMLDTIEQVTVTGLYVWLIARLWPDTLTASNWYPILLLLSEGLVVALLVFRRRTDRISKAWKDWFIAFAGTFLVLLVDAGGAPLSVSAGVFFLILGLGLHVGAKLSLLRSFGLVASDRGIKSGGLYSYVRHPMYFGYAISHIGFLLVAPSLWNVVIYVAAWSLLIARIFAEERVLGANPEYQTYMGQVRYRLVPGVF